MNFPNIDVIIPCYNAAATLARSVESVLAQPYLGRLWLIDDGSTDNTLALAHQWAAAYREKITVEALPHNGGVAKARNWGALQSSAEFIAFLDADDAYEQGALETVAGVFAFRPEVNVIRLALTPVDIAARYADHPNFGQAWQYMKMTCGGNTAFRRAFFLACGGFPQHQLFRELGGEDGALGIATTQITTVATLFNEPGVLHFCREGMHAERLLDSFLFHRTPAGVTPEKMAEAEGVTAEICRQVNALKCGLKSDSFGVQPLHIKRTSA